MYLYFRKNNTLTTVIPHGEPVRQGSTLNLYILFDVDYPDIKKKGIRIELRRPGSSIIPFTTQVPVEVPKEIVFKKTYENEIIYDLKDNEKYYCFRFKVYPENSTSIAGKLLLTTSLLTYEDDASVSTGIIQEPEDYVSIIKETTYLGRADIYVEKTYGNNLMCNNLSTAQYEQLLDDISLLNTKMNEIISSGGGGDGTAGVVGVKGDNETKYRSGFVNITAENIGITKARYDSANETLIIY